MKLILSLAAFLILLQAEELHFRCFMAPVMELLWRFYIAFP